MAIAIAIVSESGFGKSTSIGKIPKEDLGSDIDIEGINPEETLLVNIKDKPLPYRGWKKDWKLISPARPPLTENYLATTDPAMIIKTMRYFSQNRPQVKNVIVDDFQYMMAEEFVANALKTGYEKFSKMAKNVYDVINAGIYLREDMKFIIMTHSDETKTNYKIKTIGKMLDEKVTLEGLFTIILYGSSEYDGTTRRITKRFVTNYDGTYPAKSPVGMFRDLYVPNDLGLVIKLVDRYYNEVAK